MVKTGRPFRSPAELQSQAAAMQLGIRNVFSRLRRHRVTSTDAKPSSGRRCDPARVCAGPILRSNSRSAGAAAPRLQGLQRRLAASENLNC